MNVYRAKRRSLLVCAMLLTFGCQPQDPTELRDLAQSLLPASATAVSTQLGTCVELATPPDCITIYFADEDPPRQIAAAAVARARETGWALDGGVEELPGGFTIHVVRDGTQAWISVLQRDLRCPQNAVRAECLNSVHVELH
jgi:hypothetical protein